MTGADDGAETLEFWRYLLRARREVVWGNFAWFSPRTLLLSLNDQIVKRIEPPGGTGSIVDRRRMRWLAAQAARCGTSSPDLPIRIADSHGLLMLGDPGEMDASQYVLVKDLARHESSLTAAGINAALLMSDVVYPAGDINAWADAVYLPYLGEPHESWDLAQRDWGQRTPEGGFEAPLRDWHLLAMPGNHDWYDGLNGFMFHACGAEALPEVGYDFQGLTFRERIAQGLWRKPAPPERELLEPIRRMHGQDPLGVPHLPGPYYAVDLGCTQKGDHDHGNACSALRVVVVDNGVTGSIDVEQATWLRRIVSPDDAIPKIVVTGIPIAVNNEFKWLRVADPDLDLSDATYESRSDVLSILQGNDTVIATVAGDTHNYQRIDFTASSDPTRLADYGVPPLQIVAGGAGAFLSAAHPVSFDEDRLVLEHVGHRDVSPDGATLTVEERGHVRFPSREGSLLHYSSRTRGYLLVLLFLLVIDALGVIMATRSVTRLRRVPLSSTESDSRGWLVGAPWLILLLGAVIVVALVVALGWLRKAVLRRTAMGSPPSPPTSLIIRFDDWARRIAVTVAVVLAVCSAIALTEISSPRGFLHALIGSALVVGLLVAQFIPYVVQSFPRLRGSWAVWLVAALVAYRVAVTDPPLGRLLHLIEAAVIVGAAVVLGSLIYQKSAVWLTRRSFVSPPARRSLGMVRLIPWAAVAGLLFLGFEVGPQWLLEKSGFAQARLTAQVGRVLYWSTLAFLCTGLAGGATLYPLYKAREAIPARMWAWLVLVTLASGSAAAWLVTWAAPTTWLGLRVAVVASAALLAPALGILAWLCPFLLRPAKPEPEELRAYLSRRDGAKVPSDRRRALVAAALVGAIPQLESMAEASTPPFAKNILVVRSEADGVHFRAYGLNNESASTGHACLPDHPPTSDEPGGPARGFFLLDHVRVDPGTRAVTVCQTWSALEHHIPPAQRAATEPAS